MLTVPFCIKLNVSVTLDSDWSIPEFWAQIFLYTIDRASIIQRTCRCSCVL